MLSLLKKMELVSMVNGERICFFLFTPDNRNRAINLCLFFNIFFFHFKYSVVDRFSYLWIYVYMKYFHMILIHYVTNDVKPFYVNVSEYFNLSSILQQTRGVELTMSLFTKIFDGQNPLTIFAKKLHSRCSTGLETRLCKCCRIL